MKSRGDVQVTRGCGVLLRGIGECQAVSGRRLQADNHRIRADIGVCGNDRAAQTAIVVCICTGRGGGRIVRSVDNERCCQHRNQVGNLWNQPRNRHALVR